MHHVERVGNNDPTRRRRNGGALAVHNVQEAGDRAEDNGAVRARRDGGVLEGLEEVEVRIAAVGHVQVVQPAGFCRRRSSGLGGLGVLVLGLRDGGTVVRRLCCGVVVLPGFQEDRRRSELPGGSSAP